MASTLALEPENSERHKHEMKRLADFEHQTIIVYIKMKKINLANKRGMLRRRRIYHPDKYKKYFPVKIILIQFCRATPFFRKRIFKENFAIQAQVSKMLIIIIFL